MVLSIKTQHCLEYKNQTDVFNCTICGNETTNELDLSENVLVGKNQNSIKILTIKDSLLKIVPNTFANFTSMQIIFIKNCTGLSTFNQSSFNNKMIYIEIYTTDLEIVGDQIFSKLNELRTLKVNKNNIRDVHKDAFKDLIKMESIEMDQNNINLLNEGMFSNNLKLKTISFQANKIIKLTSNIFVGCSKVYKIQLQNNRINEIENNFKNNLKVLSSINLSGNICINSSINYMLPLQSNDNELKLKQCYNNFNEHIKSMNMNKITNNNLNISTLSSTDDKVLKSMNQLEYKLTLLRESTSSHQYFIYFVLFLLTGFVIYGYLLIYRRFYNRLPNIRYSNSQSSIQLL